MRMHQARTLSTCVMRAETRKIFVKRLAAPSFGRPHIGLFKRRSHDASIERAAYISPLRQQGGDAIVVRRPCTADAYSDGLIARRWRKRPSNDNARAAGRLSTSSAGASAVVNDACVSVNVRAKVPPYNERRFACVRPMRIFSWRSPRALGLTTAPSEPSLMRSTGRLELRTTGKNAPSSSTWGALSGVEFVDGAFVIAPSLSTSPASRAARDRMNNLPLRCLACNLAAGVGG